MPKEEPQPRERVLGAEPGSPMQFMREHLIFDVERDSLVRFRGPFIMPDWTGVEDNEFDYVVDESWRTLQQIANTVYNDVLKMWVIAARNHLDLPDAQLQKGMRLKIPHKDWVERKLISQAKNIVGQD